MDLTGHQATQYPCFGSPEGRFPDPLTSLRFELDGGRLWFKTTPQGDPNGWVVIAGSGGSAPTWAAVLANGSSSGPNSPSIDDGQALLFGDVALFRTSPGNLGIQGNVIPIGVRSIGSNAARWLQGFIDHLYVQYASPPSGTLLSTETYVDVVAGNYDLPLASTEGSLFFIRNAGPGATTVAPSGADTINGAASLNIPAGTLVLLVSDGGTNWVATTISGGGVGAVTLQAALDGQNALGVPTTQAYNTRIQIGDGNSWQFEDQAANDVLVIAGDNSPAAIAMTGGNAVGGAGQRITATGGAATVATQAGGAIALTGGAGNTTGSGGDISFLPGASPAGRPGLEFSLGAIARNAPLAVALPAGTTSDLSVAGLHSANVLLITPTAPGSALGGIEFLAGQDGRVLQIQNVSTTVSLTILNEDLGSAAANRFVLPTGTSLVVSPGGGLEIWHDGTSVRWRSSTDSGASAAAVTLQAALDGQNALGIPTTQGYVTNIDFNDGFGWHFQDQAANDIVVINGDSVASAFTVQGGNTAAGAGQAVSLTGGTATTATQSGGTVSITGGTGNTTGTGGNLLFFAGPGGATGQGGQAVLQGGAGGATSGNGGAALVQGGLPIDGNGGAVTIAGRNAATTTATNRNGGAVTIQGGLATPAGTGGNVAVLAGGGGATGTAGSLALTGGAAGTVSGASGPVQIQTQPSVAGATGSITLTTGNATGGVAGDVVLRGGTGTTNGRAIVQPVWTGDGQAFAIVGNGGSSAIAGLHASSRVGGPNGVVSSNPGSLLMWNPGVATAGTAYVNVSTTDPGSAWAELINANTTVLAGMPGNIYENLVGYIDSADRNSYPGSGTSVTDIFRNLTNGTLTSSTFDDGGWTWAGTTGALTFVKNANIDNIFAGGGTVIAFIRPNTAGENNFGRIADTTASGDSGWFLSVSAGASSRVGLTFQRNFNGGVADAGQWQANTVTDPWSGAAVFPVQAGSWSSVAITYDDSSVANDPIFYVNGALVPNTETITPVGTAITDVGNALLVANRTADDRTFNGSISIVLLFDRILTLSEVTDVYNLFGRRYALGMTGFPATVGMSQDISIVGGPTATATVRSGNVQIAGGESSAGGATSNGGDVIVRGGNLTGVNNGRSGNLICLSGSATNSGSSASAGTAEFGAGVHNNGNAAGLCTIHGGDNSNQGTGGNMILRGGDCITATGTNDGGGSAGIRAGNGRTGGSTPGSTFIAGGGFLSGTTGTTGDITISTQRSTLGPFPATGGTGTSTGSISILTTGAGATAGTTGNITIQCGDTNAVTGNNPGDILLQAGASASTTQSSVTAGSISLVGGANAGVGGSVGGGITLTGGASTNTGATTGTGGDITLTGGAMAHNSAASRGGNVTLTGGAATGTNGSGGSIVLVAGVSTGTGTPGSAALTAGNAAGAVAGGTASVNGGIGGATGAGGVVNINGGAGGATSGSGGQVNISGGAATDGVGGAVVITGANGAGTNRAGGAVRMIAGNGIGTASGGGAALTGGNGGATGAGGDATITSGNGGGTSGASGNIVLLAGTVTSGTQGEMRYTQGAAVRTATTSFLAWSTQTFQTTNATPFVVTLHTLTTDGRNVKIRFEINGQQTTTVNVISGTFIFMAYRSGGTVALLTSNVEQINANGFGVNPTIVLGVSGNDVIATITGIAATTINWSWYGDKQEGGA